MNQLQEDFTSIYPTMCLWCGKPLGSHTGGIINGRPYLSSIDAATGNCYSEIKKAKRMIERIEVWLFEHQSGHGPTLDTEKNQSNGPST